MKVLSRARQHTRKRRRGGGGGGGGEVIRFVLFLVFVCVACFFSFIVQVGLVDCVSLSLSLSLSVVFCAGVAWGVGA